MPKAIHSIIIFVLLQSSAYVYAEEFVTKTIPLNYRKADDVISLLQPFLHPKGVMTGDTYKILVKTSKNNFLDLQQLVAEIDVSMRQLRVSVTLDSELAKLENQQQLSSEPDNNEKGNIRSHTSGNRDGAGQTQHINVVEGKWANISSGESVPVGQRIRNPDGTITESVTYKSVNSSIQVLPRISGKQVTLFIRPQINTKTGVGDKTRTRSADTTILGDLNKWILIGGTSSVEISQPGSRIYTTQKSKSTSSQMFVKVEIIQ